MNRDLIQNWAELHWKSTKPEITEGVLGCNIVPENADVQSVTLTRVEPKGKFSIHTDDYNHVFLFLQGKGEGQLGEDSYDIRPGMIVRVPAGHPHGYGNTGDSNLVLLTINYSEI
jgi:quercetin dioxygenase-like cupin family protein